MKKCNKIYLIIKRFFDIIISFFGCLILIPTSILLKICYLLTGDKKSIIYTQERIGKNGKVFSLFKYRTMVENSDEILFDLLKTDKKLGEEYKKNKKLKHDPRVTKIGRILRKTSIDEMPQFINVLKGDMSIVGNRPYMVREKKDMGNYYKDIIKTKPGITGVWQTSGRNSISFKKRLKLEKNYSNNYNLKKDIRIFFKTFIVIFKKDDAL